MIKQIVQLLHSWLCGDKRQYAALKAQTTQKTACKWYDICRRFCKLAVKRDRTCIGGFGKTVEIDETIFGQRKYHRGRKKSSMYVIGGIEHPARRSKPQIGRQQQQQQIFLEIISDRSARTLESTIVKHVNLRTTIITDCWAGYNNIKSLGYRHKTVNHSKNFVDPRTGASTQSIESLWSHLREFLPRRGLRPNRMESYLYEFVYKRNHFGQFEQFLATIVTFTEILPHISRDLEQDMCMDDDDNDDDEI